MFEYQPPFFNLKSIFVFKAPKHLSPDSRNLFYARHPFATLLSGLNSPSDLLASYTACVVFARVACSSEMDIIYTHVRGKGARKRDGCCVPDWTKYPLAVRRSINGTFNAPFSTFISLINDPNIPEIFQDVRCIEVSRDASIAVVLRRLNQARYPIAYHF